MESTSIILRTAMVAAVLSIPAVASAQLDHLQCHKVKDGQKFKGAVVSLAAANAAFQAAGDCEVKGKAAEYCTVVTKTVVDPGDAPVPSVLPVVNPAASDYLCYKVKCPKGVFADSSVIDQFGSRTLFKIKEPGKLCVPVGASVTTTTMASAPIFRGALADGAMPWSYAGMLGVAAVNAQCAAEFGADHLCSYLEIVEADGRGELASLGDGTQFWLHRLTSVESMGTVAAGAGGRCNDWTYQTAHIADSEFGVWSGGAVQYYLDANTCYTGNAADGCQGAGYTWSAPGDGPGVHVKQGGGECFASMAMLCCD